MSADALQQTEFLLGRDILCNPPFEHMSDYITLLETAYDKDPKTRCILVAPERPTADWFPRLTNNPTFQLLEIYPAETAIFSAFNDRNPLIRKPFYHNCERIIIFEVN